MKALFNPGRLLRFLVSLGQLALLFFTLRAFSLEKGSGFNEVSFTIILPVFAVYAFTPRAFRPLLLTALALAILYYAFGMVSGSILLAAGLFLIGCCHLPLPFWLRVSLVLISGAVFAAIRADLFYAPRAALVMPFLGSMFMFRMILYLYEIRHRQLTGTLFQRISYFFLFPNLFFQLFPIVDYKTAWKNFCARPDEDNWQKGIRWMLRGTTHLFAYRIIYYYFLIGPSQVHDLPTLLQYITCSYALVLRLSGLFHFIAGLLCLFGFNLHPVFNNYFLATSFVDLWRRINVYWREFVMKIFFYPIIFKVRRKTLKHALAITMMCSFAITWALHNYQWFWIRGYFPLAPTDILFWFVLGICITSNSVWLERRLNAPAPAVSRWDRFFRILRMTGIFLFMSVMWSLWGSNTLTEWFAVLSKGAIATPSQLIGVLLISPLILGTGLLAWKIITLPTVSRLLQTPPHETFYLTIPTLLLFAALSFQAVQKKLPAPLSAFVTGLAEERLNTSDRENAERGYYKKLLDGDNEGPAGLWETNLKRPKTFTSIDEITIRTHDILLRTLKPASRIRVNDYVIETNVLGLRDQDYTMMKPENTFRIALLGGSYEMGSGVNNNEVFEKIVEDMLNANNTDTSYGHFEIWNYGMGGYHVVQAVELCNTRAFEGQPDALIYVAHSREADRLVDHFAELIRTGMDLKYPFLKRIKSLCGARQTMSKTIIRERLTPFAQDIIAWSYMQIALQCKKFRTVPVWAYLPATADIRNQEEFAFLKKISAQCGFVQMDLSDVYQGVELNSIRVSGYDTHPNASGHAIIAKRFYRELLRNWMPIVRRKK